MKKITLLLCFLMAANGFAQVNLEDFEGAAPDLFFQNGPGSATIVSDDANAGPGTYLQVITAAASAPWQQAELTMQGDFIDLSGATKIVTVDVYSDVPFDMLARVNSGVASSTDGTPVPDSATADSHTGSGWETLSFDFTQPRDIPDVANGIYEKIFFFNLWNDSIPGWNCSGDPDCSDDSIASLTFVDNVTALAASPPPTCTDGMMNGDETGVDCGGSFCAPCPVPPTEPAPTPPNRDEDEVFSIYSNAYNNDITGNITLDAGFCGFGLSSEVTINGDDTILFSTAGGPCLGWDWINPGNIANPNGPVDVSDFDYLHFDFYTDDPNLFNGDGSPKAVSFKFPNFANGGVVETSAVEFLFRANNSSPGFILETGTWISVDVNLNNLPTGDPPAFLGSIDRNALGQFVLTAAGISNLWFDNIYFHKNTLSVDDFAASNFKVYPNPTRDNWNVSSTGIVNSIAVYDILGKKVLSLQPNTKEVAINTTTLNPGMYFAEIKGANGSKTVKLIKE